MPSGTRWFGCMDSAHDQISSSSYPSIVMATERWMDSMEITRFLSPRCAKTPSRPFEGTASNSYVLSYLQESMQGARDFLSQKPLQILNLFPWNWNW